MKRAALPARPLYFHRQTGWPILFSSLLPFIVLAAWRWATPTAAHDLPPALVPLLCGVGLIALSFSWLTVVVTETHLVFRFGIGLFRRAIAMTDICDVAVIESRWYEGWGIHWTRRGMLYNVGGFETVALALADGTTVRLGSDEASRLRGAVVHALERLRDARGQAR